MQPDVAPELRAGLLQDLHGKQQPCHAGLHIRRTAAQDLFVGHRAAERIEVPLTAVTGRYYIQMAVQDYAEALVASQLGHNTGELRIVSSFLIGDAGRFEVILYKIHHRALGASGVFTGNLNQL